MPYGFYNPVSLYYGYYGIVPSYGFYVVPPYGYYGFYPWGI
jgi:hypothetical protein